MAEKSSFRRIQWAVPGTFPASWLSDFFQTGFDDLSNLAELCWPHIIIWKPVRQPKASSQSYHQCADQHSQQMLNGMQISSRNGIFISWNRDAGYQNWNDVFLGPVSLSDEERTYKLTMVWSSPQLSTSLDMVSPYNSEWEGFSSDIKP